MGLSPLTVKDQQAEPDDIVLTSWHEQRMVVGRISKAQLEEYFGRQEMPMQEAKRFAVMNLNEIHQVMDAKYRAGDFHLDTIDGNGVACIHVSISELIEAGGILPVHEWPARMRYEEPRAR